MKFVTAITIILIMLTPNVVYADFTYQLTEAGVKRSDGVYIPNHPGNRHWREYQEWLGGGNTPEPAEVTPEKVDPRIVIIDGIKDIEDVKNVLKELIVGN